MTPPPVWAMTLCAVLLRLAPGPFRRRFGGEMLQTLRDQHRALGNAERGRRMAFWLRAVCDVLRTAARERAETMGTARSAGRMLIAAAGAHVAFDLATPSLEMGIQAALLTALVTVAGAVLSRRPA